MAEATQEMIALAREIACEQWPSAHDFPEREAAEAAALAAIQATTERAAALVSDIIDDARMGEIDSDLRCIKHIMISRLAEGAHLKEQSA